jgi:hypothetical protein
MNLIFLFVFVSFVSPVNGIFLSIPVVRGNPVVMTSSLLRAFLPLQLNF